MTAIKEVEFLAWRAGKAWSAWHLYRLGGVPLCGARIPDTAATCTSRSIGKVIGLGMDQLCRKCLQEYAKEGKESETPNGET